MTPQMTDLEAWALFGKWILAAGGIAGAVLSIVKLIGWIRSKTSVAKLEADSKQHAVWLNNDHDQIKQLNCHVEQIDQRIDEIEDKRLTESVKINQSLQMLGTSLCAILNHLIDGEGKEEMKQKRDELTNFFIKK
jgi:hypothetical protein